MFLKQLSMQINDIRMYDNANGYIVFEKVKGQ